MHDDTYVTMLTKRSYNQLEGEFTLESINRDLMPQLYRIVHNVCRIGESSAHDIFSRNQSTIICMPCIILMQSFTIVCMEVILACY